MTTVPPMRYTINSDFAREYDKLVGRLRHRRVIHTICWWTLRLSLPAAYCGLLLAVMIAFCGMPFQVLAWCKISPPSVKYWISAITIVLACLLCLYLLGRRALLDYRRGVLNIELLFVIVGILFSICLIAIICPRGL